MSNLIAINVKTPEKLAEKFKKLCEDKKITQTEAITMIFSVYFGREEGPENKEPAPLMPKNEFNELKKLVYIGMIQSGMDHNTAYIKSEQATEHYFEQRSKPKPKKPIY